MEVAEAVETAENDPDVQEHKGKGYYLSSLMAIPENLNEITEWTLVYFNPDEQRVFSAEVTPGGVSKGEASTPLIEGDYQELEHKGALPAKDLLSRLTDVLAAQREVPTKVIITLRNGEWKVAVVTRSLKMLRIDLDMKSGKLKHIDKSSLVKTA
ncbi:MAG: hypothetical protein KAW41_02850 [Candidatus Diapherotrites archaeon]|nr:hypothetical protein [Candidatus Diapherotrites archaeon]